MAVQNFPPNTVQRIQPRVWPLDGSEPSGASNPVSNWNEVYASDLISVTNTYFNGNASGRGTAFFLPPHSQLVTMQWSSGAAMEHKVAVTKIDQRAQYSFFQYHVRTSDNVELLLVSDPTSQARTRCAEADDARTLASPVADAPTDAS